MAHSRRDGTGRTRAFHRASQARYWVIWIRSANSHTGSQLTSCIKKPDRWQHPTRCQTNPKTACAPGGVHRWKADIWLLEQLTRGHLELPIGFVARGRPLNKLHLPGHANLYRVALDNPTFGNLSNLAECWTVVTPAYWDAIVTARILHGASMLADQQRALDSDGLVRKRAPARGKFAQRWVAGNERAAQQGDS